MESQDLLRTKLLSEDISTYEDLVATLSPARRATIATSLLEACLVAGLPQEKLNSIVEIGKDRTRWHQGHDAFDAVRELTLGREMSKPANNDPSYIVLLVAENVARVIYNATEPSDPFDDDSAAWFFLTFAQLSRHLNSGTLIDRAHKLLSDELLGTSPTR